MRFRAALMMGALLVVTTAGAVFGQGFKGGLRGSVKDSGGVIPGVEVTLVNEQTNINRSTVTNERGEYAFAAVAGPRGIPDRHDRSDGHSLGRWTVQSAAGSDQRVAALARRRDAPR